MRKFRVTRHELGNDGYPTYKDYTYTEEEVLAGLNVYKYDSIVEIKELDENDEVLKAFKESVKKNEEQREQNRQRRLAKEKQREDEYIKSEYEKRFRR